IDVEVDAMGLVAGRLEVETPAVRGRGILEGWDYREMSRLAGSPLREVEADLSPGAAHRLAEAICTQLPQLQRLEVPASSQVREVVPDWGAFLTAHRDQRAALEEARETPPVWIERLTAHLADWRYVERPTATLLHADLTHDHLLLEQAAGEWRLS